MTSRAAYAPAKQACRRAIDIHEGEEVDSLP